MFRKKLFTTVFSILITLFVSTQANAKNFASPLLNNKGHIDVNASALLSGQLVSACYSLFKGKAAQNCQLRCGMLNQPVTALANAINQKQKSKQAIQSAGKGYVQGVLECAKIWPNKKNLPKPIQPFIELAKLLESNRIPNADPNASPNPVRPVAQNKKPAFNPFKSKNAPSQPRTYTAPRTELIEPSLVSANNNINEILPYTDQIRRYVATVVDACPSYNQKKCQTTCAGILNGLDMIKEGMAKNKTSRYFMGVLDATERSRTWCLKYKMKVPEIDAIKTSLNYLKEHSELFVSTEMASIKPFYQSDDGKKKYLLKLSPEMVTLSPKVMAKIPQGKPDFSDTNGQIDINTVLTAMETVFRQQCPATKKRLPGFLSNCDQVCGMAKTKVYLGANNGWNNVDEMRDTLSRTAQCLNMFENEKRLSSETLTVLKYYQVMAKGQHPLSDNVVKNDFMKLNVNLLERSASCQGSDLTPCYLACQNALSVSESLEGFSRSNHVAIKPIEDVLVDYLKECQRYTAKTKVFDTRVLNDFTVKLEQHVFSEPMLAKAEQQKTQNKTSPKISARSADRAYLDRFGPEENSPYVTLTSSRLDKIQVDINDIVDAYFTLNNYCPDVNGCIAPMIFPHVLNAVYGDVPKDQRDKIIGHYLKNTIGRSSDPDIDTKSLARGGTSYLVLKRLPDNNKPPQFDVIEQFVSQLLAMETDLSSSGIRRVYCDPSINDKANPFIGSKGCEYLSALYYGDFASLAHMDVEWVAPMLKRNQDTFNSLSPHLTVLINKIDAIGNADAREGSLIKPLSELYILGFDRMYSSCFVPEAKSFFWSNTRITNYVNGWGTTLRTNVKKSSDEYKINPAMLPIYYGGGKVFDSEHIALAQDIEKIMSKRKKQESSNKSYRPEPIFMGDLGNGLVNMMNTYACTDAVPQKLEKRIIEYWHFRKKYEAFLNSL